MRLSALSGLSLAVLPVVVWAAPAQAPRPALGPLVITATTTPTPAAELGSSVTVITRADIEREQASSVTELLQRVSGIHTAQQGGVGQQTSLFMRGTNSNHVLVLIDGVEASDPSNPTGQFDFANLRVDDIQRIEVVRGPQSVLYGSDAIGGVIQIFTRRAKQGSPLRWRLRNEAGRYNTVQGNGGADAGWQRVQAGASYSYADSESYSAASEYRGNTEPDRFRNLTLAGYVNSQPTDNTQLNASLRRVRGNAAVDDYASTPPFAFADDVDENVLTTQWLGRLEGGLDLFDQAWKQRLSLDIDRWNRVTENGPLPDNTNAGSQHFRGRKTQLNWRHDLRLSRAQQLVVGLEHEENEADTAGLDHARQRDDAVYVQHQFAAPHNPFSSTLGLRYDDNEDFGRKLTWRATGAWRSDATGTRLHASYGTGFKAPTLTQLFDDTFSTANPNLKPEESRGWDAGVEQALWSDAVHLGVTYFHNDIRNLISGAPPTFRNVNIGRATTRGIEFEARAQLLKTLQARLNYTHTRAQDQGTGERLLRRPRDQANLSLDWHATQPLSLGLDAYYVGARRDIAGFATTAMRPYTVLATRASYRINTNWRVEARVENLLNLRHENVYGYGTSGRAAYVALAIDY